ncbi:helicase RepA family protein [Rubripirellula amarantea]|nr:helicase RepA family protein [Rubripirellula amarantea]
MDNAKPNEDDPKNSEAFDDCFADLMALDLEDHRSEPQRLFAACCRCVEWDLSEDESLRCLGKYNHKRSFGLMLNDDTVRRRLRDAERKVERGSRLPARPLAVERIGDLVAGHPELRRPVIHGLLREGETMNVIASPKVGKSWLVTDLALAVATGRDWLDTFKCEAGDVLIIDNELHSETSANRIPKVMNARGIELADVGEGVFVANVRGQLQDINKLASELMMFEPGCYQLIVLDAFYRFLPAKMDENDNAAMAAIYNLIDSVASRLRCCFVLVHHSSKGNQSGKSVTDVGAGAGSQSRATDTHLVLRQHEEPDAIVLDAAVRSWPPIMPRCLRFVFPAFMLADDLSPLDLKPERPRKKKQRDEPENTPVDPEEEAEQFACDFVTPEPQTMAAILDAAVETGMARRAAERLLKRAERSKRVHRWSRDANRHIRFASDAEPKPAKTDPE